MTTKPTRNTLYCGDPPMRFSNLFRSDPEGGYMSLFKGRRVFPSYNTRVAIRAACDLLELQPGDGVLAPAYNCGSEVDPLIHAGLSVRLFPVAQDLIADPARIEPLISPRTKALYVIHYFGVIQPALAELRELCDRHGLRMIEDCALSLLSGASPAEGRTGDVSVFCFYKFVPVLGGGALVINAPDLQSVNPFNRPAPRKVVVKTLVRTGLTAALGSTRAKGMVQALKGKPVAENAPLENDKLEDIPGHYYFDPALLNAGMSVFASRPLKSFSVSQAISARRSNWQRYRDLLEGSPGVHLLLPELAPETCPLNMPVMVADRDRVVQTLQSKGIGATPWWAGFNRNLDWSGQEEAMALKNKALSLPLHQYLGAAHLDYITAQLQAAL